MSASSSGDTGSNGERRGSAGPRAPHGLSISILGLDVRLPAPDGPEAVERRIAVFVRVALVVAVALPLVGLLPELIYLAPDLNDGAFHQGVMANTIAAVGEGHDPLDFWFPTWVCGFPLFHYYQPGPYLLLAALHWLTFGALSNLFLYRLATVLVLALVPLAFYRASRWLELPREAAAWAALAVWWINGGAYGIELGSFTWAGWGLFSQAVALPVLPLAVAAGVRAVRGERSRLIVPILVAAGFVLHVLYGYIAALSLVLVPALAGNLDELRRRAARLAVLGAQSFALVAFFVVPLAAGIGYHLKSKYDPVEKFNSLGAQKVLVNLAAGDLFDRGRLPVLTVLLFAGLFLAWRSWTDEKSQTHGFLVLGLGFWLALYFGRTTWGPLTNLLPLSHGLHMERLSSGVHLFGLWLAAVAAGWATRFLVAVPGRRLRAAACSAALVPLLSPVTGTTRMLAADARLVHSARAAYGREAADLAPVLAVLKAEPWSRVYVGHSGNWGRNYKAGPVEVYHLLSAAGITHLSNMPFSWALTNDFQQHFATWERSHYDLFDVSFVLTDQRDLAPPGGALVSRSGKNLLYRVPNEGPFAIVSVPLAVVGDKDSTWYINTSWMKLSWSREHAHAQLVFTGRPLEGVPVVTMVDELHLEEKGSVRNVFAEPRLFTSPAPPPPRGVLSAARLARQDASVRVELSQPGVVLFKATYHPLWHAWIDGRRTGTVILTPGMIGVPMPAGSHQLRLAYEPGWSKEILLLAGVAFTLAVHRLQRRRDDAPGVER